MQFTLYRKGAIQIIRDSLGGGFSTSVTKCRMGNMQKSVTYYLNSLLCTYEKVLVLMKFKKLTYPIESIEPCRVFFVINFVGLFRQMRRQHLSTNR